MSAFFRRLRLLLFLCVFIAGAAAPSLCRADTLGYPWPTDTQAPCKFGAAGGSSCKDPNNPGDTNNWYDWGVYDGNGAFHQYHSGYEYRNCTDYVQWKESTIGVSVPGTWGNGGQWYNSATSTERSTTPAAWDAAVVPGNPGHVAFVESVNSIDSSNQLYDNITVSEYNHDAQGDGDKRTGTAISMGFTEFVDFGKHPAGSGSSTADNTRIALSSGAQYIWERGVTMPVGYADAVRYNTEGNTSVQTNWSGPVNTVPLPPNTIFRPVGSLQQYLWTSSSQKLPINDGATSQCLFASFTGSNPSGQLAVVPADWASGISQGPTAQCSLADGIRFTETDTGSQQYVSVRGAALTVGYGDGLAYDGESDPYYGLSMPAGYIQQSIHAAVLPANTVLRAAASPQQYLWDGSQLHAINDGATSGCLLFVYPQNGIAVVPPSWTSGRSQGAAAQCSLPDGTRFTESDTYPQQYVSVRGAAFSLYSSDATAYDGEGDTGITSMPAGYIQQSIHAAVLPTNTVLRAAGAAAQYLWDGSMLHYIPDGSTSSCLLTKYPQNGVALVPPSWESAQSIGSDQTCS